MASFLKGFKELLPSSSSLGTASVFTLEFPQDVQGGLKASALSACVCSTPLLLDVLTQSVIPTHPHSLSPSPSPHGVYLEISHANQREPYVRGYPPLKVTKTNKEPPSCHAQGFGHLICFALVRFHAAVVFDVCTLKVFCRAAEGLLVGPVVIK